MISRPSPQISPAQPAALRLALLCALCLGGLSNPGLLRAQESAPQSSPSPAVSPNPAASRALAALDILPVGEESTGVVLPDYDLQGNLLSVLKARSATRTSDTDITLEEMTLTLAQEAPRSDLLIDLPAARYDISSSMLFGLRDVRISRDDFLLTGDTLEFDTKTRRGIIRGSIKMVLHNKPFSNAANP